MTSCEAVLKLTKLSADAWGILVKELGEEELTVYETVAAITGAQ